MRIGLSFDLKIGQSFMEGLPDDAFEEFDSPSTIDFIESALKSEHHEVVRLGGGQEFLTKIREAEVDIVFNISEGQGCYRSREAQVPAVLEMLNIPYTGSDPQCLSICLDKPLTKKLALAEDIITPAWRIINNTGELEEGAWSDFPLPVIIKPVFEGSSKGIRTTSLAHNIDLATKIIRQQLEDYRQPVMLEEFVTGDEVTVGIIGNSPPKVLGIMRVVPRRKDKSFVYSLEVKRDWKNQVDYECPAQFPQSVLDRIEELSIRAFQTLGCRDFARLDYRVRQGVPYFIEINPLPGLGDYSDLVIMAVKLGWTHEALIKAILRTALERSPACAQK